MKLNDHRLWMAIPVLFVILDALTTIFVIETGIGSEANPIMVKLMVQLGVIQTMVVTSVLKYIVLDWVRRLSLVSMMAHFWLWVMAVIVTAIPVVNNFGVIFGLW